MVSIKSGQGHAECRDGPGPDDRFPAQAGHLVRAPDRTARDPPGPPTMARTIGPDRAHATEVGQQMPNDP